MKPIIFDVKDYYFEFLVLPINYDSDMKTQALIGIVADKELVHLYLAYLKIELKPSTFWKLSAAIFVLWIVRTIGCS